MKLALQTPLLSRGGVAARQRKSCEATLARADGVVLIKRMIFLTNTTPAAATASAFPSSAEEGSLSQHCSLNEEFLATDYADLADFNPFNPRNPWLKIHFVR